MNNVSSPYGLTTCVRFESMC